MLNPFKKKLNFEKLLIASLNARLQPKHRGEMFEDPLEEYLNENRLGEISGGGTMQMTSGEIEYCDIEISVIDYSADTRTKIISALEKLGAPIGSKLHCGEDQFPFGQLEGFALYLNGTDLDPEVYENCDSNYVFSEIDRLLVSCGKVFSYWQGPTETAFYVYGKSYNEINERLSELIANYPLCRKSRIEKIA